MVETMGYQRWHGYAIGAWWRGFVMHESPVAELAEARQRR
jgi:hypothetical protein